MKFISRTVNDANAILSELKGQIASGLEHSCFDTARINLDKLIKIRRALDNVERTADHIEWALGRWQESEDPGTRQAERLRCAIDNLLSVEQKLADVLSRYRGDAS